MKSDEWNYRREERLGLLCGSDKPTQAQVDIAENEADAFELSQLDAGTQAALERIQEKSRERHPALFGME